jgi:hypothetical protein
MILLCVDCTDSCTIFYMLLLCITRNFCIGGGVNGSVANGHYGPGDRKSRKEIMEEIIAKSKVTMSNI